MTAVCMIYGATGFTGRLILDAALARGLRPIVAGRCEQSVKSLAARHQLPFRVFSLADSAALAEALADVDAVLNAAGLPPDEAAQLAQSCLDHGAHHLDTGCEPRGLERLLMLDEAAREAGLAVVYGMGFSPAVAEALAVHLKRRLPDTVRLAIALSTSARLTPGLLRSGVGIALRPSAALRRGRVKTMRRFNMRHFDFGRGPERCYRLGWGELAAIHRATTVRNVDFFVRARPDLLRLLRLSPLVAACRRLPMVRARFEAFAAARGLRPARDERRKPGRSHMTGYAYDPTGQRAASRIHLHDPYTVTAALAAEALVRATTAPPQPGVHTAGQYLGPDFLAEIPGLHVDWEELELSAPGELNLRIRRQSRLPFRTFLSKLRPQFRDRQPLIPAIMDMAAIRPSAGPETEAGSALHSEGHAPAAAGAAESEGSRAGGTDEGLRRTGTD